MLPRRKAGRCPLMEVASLEQHAEQTGPIGYEPFQPRPWLRNAHLQTIFGNILAAHQYTLPVPVAQLVEVSPARGSQISSQVLCECHWQPLPERASRPTVIMLHGLEGSAHSQYVVGNANKLWQAGCNVVRMNMRNCGGTERLTPTLYHSGLSGDVERVMRLLRRDVCAHVGIAHRLLDGRQSRAEARRRPGRCGTEGAAQRHRRLARGGSRSVGRRTAPRGRTSFTSGAFCVLCSSAFDARPRCFPARSIQMRAAGIGSVREFDDRITALYSGFRSADDYYFRAAPARVLERIAVPTLVIHAADDPFIRLTDETRAKISANPHIWWLETEHGGHCAFLAAPDKKTGSDGYWAEQTALRFVLANA